MLPGAGAFLPGWLSRGQPWVLVVVVCLSVPCRQRAVGENETRNTRTAWRVGAGFPRQARDADVPLVTDTSSGVGRGMSREDALRLASRSSPGP